MDFIRVMNLRVWQFGAISVLISLSIQTVAVEPASIPEKQIEIASPMLQEVEITAPSTESSSPKSLEYAQISQIELEQALDYAVTKGDLNAIRILLKYYRQLANTDQTLIDFAEAQIAKKTGDHQTAIRFYRIILARNAQLTPVRIQLATSLFQLHHDAQARSQFEAALSDPQLPADIRHLVQQYLQALDRRNEWQFSISLNYLRERNVNNVSDSAYIENTAFKKNEVMLPQKANGIAYAFGIARDFNLHNAHFVHFSNQLYAKNYWDNHNYDDIQNRTYLGYRYKQANAQFGLLPFYERQWYGNHRYKWGQGIRLNWQWWLNSNWQLSNAAEYSKQRYFSSYALNGHSKLFSVTLLWQIKPTRFVYAGLDFSQERTSVRQYSYDLKTLRLGWGEEWGAGISSRLNISYSKRQYRDNLALAGGTFRFDKTRSDKIYQVNATIWKRDWHLWGITPKLNFRWKQQQSNFDSLYSYTDKSVNMLIEKSF